MDRVDDPSIVNTDINTDADADTDRVDKVQIRNEANKAQTWRKPQIVMIIVKAKPDILFKSLAFLFMIC